MVLARLGRNTFLTTFGDELPYYYPLAYLSQRYKQGMKIDPHGHKERYLGWKERTKNGIPEISKENSDIILKFIYQMELGLNVSIKSKKGARSYIRLNTLRDKMMFFTRNIKLKFGLDDITKISEEQIHNLFMDMRNGNIKRQDGKNYESAAYYVKAFKTFWHWYTQIKRKENIEIADITLYLDTKVEKPKWVYLNEEEVRKLCDKVKFNYRVLILFLYDSGIRAPTELVNVKVGDFYDDFTKLQIRDENSKTFGRKINLLLCSQLLRQYVSDLKLKPEDYIFNICPKVVNKYLNRVGERMFGQGASQGGEKYPKLTMYDFRHSSACYWLPRYKSETALKYRFGWKKSEMIHYYTEFLGMKDTISEEDLLMDISKTEIEKKLERSEKEKMIMQDRMQTMEMQMAKIMELTKQLGMEVKYDKEVIQIKNY